MTTTPIGSTAAASAASASASLSGYASLGEKDFLAMLTTELTNQDPTAPVDQKEMVAQMAQFSSLAGINTSNATLTSIATKLDSLIAQGRTTPVAATASTTASTGA